VLVFRPDSVLAGYQVREFTLGERLLTEARVVCWYLWSLLIPNTQQMSLYHDDIVLSTGLLSPPTTVLSIIVIGGLLAAGWLLRTRLPALGFAIFWFFGGHLLESTVIPLEIAYEHRNYVPSVGIVLGGVVLVANALQGVERRQLVQIALAVIVVGMLSVLTWSRAQNWSDPILTPIVEANNNPNSSRAQIQAGLTYGFLAKRSQSEEERLNFVRQGSEHYSQAKKLQPNSPNPLFGEIMLYYESGLNPPPLLFDALQIRLEQGFLDATSYNGTQVLVDCWFAEVCRFSETILVRLLNGVLENPHSFAKHRANALYNLAKFHAEKAQNIDTAIPLLKQAIAINPKVMNYHLSLINLLIAQGDKPGAQQVFQNLLERDDRHLYREQIDAIAQQLRE
jgi:hypothetical protein